MQVTKEGIERIKGTNDLAAVVSERGIETKKKGRVLVARCPFHSPDKTPSFTITPSKGLFHCFGCGASGDVIGFVTKHDKTTFAGALETLARRAGLDLEALMQERPRLLQRTPLQALTPPATSSSAASNGNGQGARPPASPVVAPGVLLAKVVEHYHRTLLAHGDAQAYLKTRGLTDTDLWRTFELGYADGSLLQMVPKDGELRERLLSLGVVTKQGRELLGGCVVFPIPDPVSGAWTTLYGRGLRAVRHCYLPGPLRGVWNYQSARSASEVVLVESVIDALSFHQAGITTAIPLYGANGFTGDHLDTLLKSPGRRVVLCLDNDEAGRQAAQQLERKLAQAGLVVRIATLPQGIKDPNQLLVSRNGDAGEVLRQVLTAAAASVGAAPAPPVSEGAGGSAPQPGVREEAAEGLTVRFGERLYHAKAFNLQATDRLRVVLRVETSDGRFLVDAADLYAARSRKEYAKRAASKLSADAFALEEELLALLTHLEAFKDESQKKDTGVPQVAPLSDAEKHAALAFLRRADLLDQVALDIDSLGYVGEEVNKRLLYLVAISRKLEDPLSAVILSQSGAGKSGITEVIEKLCPPEDVVLFTRLTPQSLYYTAPGFLDQKLVIVEERYGSLEADYSIRVLQSRKKLIAAAPVKDPQTGNLRTKTFIVEARCAFIEATTANSVNFENATRCFELSMDESSEQTRKIHERQRTSKTERGLEQRRAAEEISRCHWNAQRLLEPLPVVIPFADKLTFPFTWMRTRRDHARFLNLIEVSAFLHQHQRGRAGSGAIVADVSDYAVAYQLAGNVLQETLADLRKPLRDFLEDVKARCADKCDGVSRRELREKTGLPDTTLIRYLRDLVDLEYLQATGGKDKPFSYAPTADSKAKPLLGLLAPQELAKLLKDQ